MRKLLFSCLFGSILIACLSSAFATDVSGPVSGTWAPAGNPYNVVGEISVPSGQSLVIEPGVQVIFQGWYKFLIYGRLQALGTEADSITFIAADTSHGWHGLRFHDINTQPDSSRLLYCKITYGRSSGVNSAGEDKNGGAIFCLNSGKLRIEHCLIAHNRTGDVAGATGYQGTGGLYGIPGGPGENVSSGEGGAICLANSSPLIVHSSFCLNGTGDATGGAGGQGGDIINNAGAIGSAGGPGGNGKSGYGGAIYIGDSAPIISASVFAQNSTGDALGGAGGRGGNATSTGTPWGEAYGGNGGQGGDGEAGVAGSVFASELQPVLFNDLFQYNGTGNGIGGAGGDGGSAWTYEMWGMDPGEGGNGGDGSGGNGGCIYSMNSGGIDSFLTVSQHHCGTGTAGLGGAQGGGIGPTNPGMSGTAISGDFVIHGTGPQIHTISNSIIWDNVGQIFSGHPQVEYSCIEGGYPGIGNINTDPLFVSTSLGNYFLSQIAAGQAQQSPCVDAGDPNSTQIAGTTRTDGVLDIGIVDMGYHYPEFAPQPILALSTTALACTAAYGGANPEDMSFAVLNVGTGGLMYQVSENITWLSVSPTSGGPVFGSNPDTIAVMIDITGLPLGIYEGEITVTAPGAAGSPAQVQVSLYVGYSSLLTTPVSLSFIGGIGGSNPPAQVLTIANTGVGGLFFTVEENVDWMTVTPTAGGPVPPPATISVMVEISGLSIGNYQGYIIINSPPSLSSPDTVRVSLFVGEPVLEVAPDSLTFTCYTGGSNPQSQSITLSNSGSGALFYTIEDTVDWLSSSPESGGPVPPPATINVAVNNAGLPAGIYESDLSIAAAGAIGSPHLVHVSFQIVAGLSGPLTGTIAAGSYNIFADISVPSGSSLILEPGVVFLFATECQFDIYGNLTAVGTANDSINFLPMLQDSYWDGMRFFDAGASLSRLEYCRLARVSSGQGIIHCTNSSPLITHCSISQYSVGYAAAIQLGQNSNPEISYCEIEISPGYNTKGIYITQYSSPIIQHCSISAYTGMGVQIYDAGSPTFQYCTLSGGNIGFYCVRFDSIIIDHCTISGVSGTAIRLEEAQAARISFCTISDNTGESSGGGIRITDIDAAVEISHCVLNENSAWAGGAVYIDYAAANISNCTISGNMAQHYGSAVYNHNPYGEYVNVENSILQGNVSLDNSGAIFTTPGTTYGVYFGHGDCYNNQGGNFGGYNVAPELGQIVTTNLNGDSCDAFYNIFLDPLFVNPDSGDYHLTAESPCIDAGNPIGPLDPDSTIADMGAFYFDHIAGIGGQQGRFIPETFFLEGNYPNPFNAATIIRFGLPVASWVTVKVFDIAGRVVGARHASPLQNGWMPAGVHQVTFDGSDLASGIYLIRFRAGNFREVEKMVLLK